MTFQKKNYFIILSLVGLFLLCSFLFVRPLLKDIKKEIMEINEQRKNFFALQKEAKALKIFQERYQEAKDIQKIKNFFVDLKVPVDFIAFLEETARTEKISLEISSLPFDEEKEGQLGPALRFLLKCEGSFFDFYSFLDKLEKAPYLIEFENLNIQKKEKGSKEPIENIIDASLSLRVLAREPNI